MTINNIIYIMKLFTRIYTQISKRPFSTSCNTTCKADYIWSPLSASLITGSLFSIIIKESINTNLLYITRQNEEIIIRLKRLEENNAK